MKMNVWHFLISYQLTSLLPCKVFSSLLLFQTKYFQFLLSSAWPTRRSSPSCRRPWPGSSSRTTTMGRRWAGKGEIGSQETHCNGEAEKTDERAQREAIGKAGKAKEEFHLLKAVFDLFKKVPERVLNLWESSSLCSSWRWPARLVENPPRGLASPRLHGESNFCNSCGQQQERTSFQCGWKRGDPKAKSVGSWKSRELCHCKDKPLAVERDGSRKMNILADIFSFK